MSQHIYGSQSQLESQPSIEFQPTNLEYQAQEVGSSAPVRQAQLHNRATWPVILSDLQLEGEQAADFSVYADTHGTVEPGDSLPVDVLFSPSEVGTRNAHVSALADDGFGAYLALMGIGTKAGSVNEGQPGNQNDGIASYAESPEAAQTESLEDGDIASNLASIQIVHKTRNRLMLEPWKIFEKYPANNQKKKRLYTAVDKAKRALRKAEQAFAAAEEGEAKEKALAAFQDAAAKAETATHALRDAIIGSYWKDHEAGQTAKREEAAQRKRVEKLQEEAKKNESEEHAKKLADARKKLGQLTALKGEYYAEVEAEVESRMELAIQEQNIYEVTVDGETIRLVDHVNAYATVLAEGLDGDALEEKQQGKSKMIDDALDAGNFSDSIKKILSTVAKHEGGFTTINTYDKAVLTWGFMQWTGGNRSDLTAALRIIKDVQPEAFERRFQRYGIDVQRNQLIITDAEGKQVKATLPPRRYARVRH